MTYETQNRFMLLANDLENKAPVTKARETKAHATNAPATKPLVTKTPVTKHVVQYTCSIEESGICCPYHPLNFTHGLRTAGYPCKHVHTRNPVCPDVRNGMICETQFPVLGQETSKCPFFHPNDHYRRSSKPVVTQHKPWVQPTYQKEKCEHGLNCPSLAPRLKTVNDGKYNNFSFTMCDKYHPRASPGVAIGVREGEGIVFHRPRQFRVNELFDAVSQSRVHMSDVEVTHNRDDTCAETHVEPVDVKTKSCAIRHFDVPSLAVSKNGMVLVKI
jgi:hypothetical protein